LLRSRSLSRAPSLLVMPRRKTSPTPCVPSTVRTSILNTKLLPISSVVFGSRSETMSTIAPWNHALTVLPTPF